MHEDDIHIDDDDEEALMIVLAIMFAVWVIAAAFILLCCCIKPYRDRGVKNKSGSIRRMELSWCEIILFFFLIAFFPLFGGLVVYLILDSKFKSFESRVGETATFVNTYGHVDGKGVKVVY
jgi:uncharacterized membrane protein YhaH (DUF805 family)